MRNATATSRPIRSRLAPWLCALALGCGEEASGDKDTLSLPTPDAGIDTGGWVFGGDTGDSGSGDAIVVGQTDTAVDAGGGAPDTSATDAAAGDAAVADASADAGPVEITTCAGSCGLYLEGNPCHCNHGCVEAGDCCGGSGAFLAACACNVDGDCDDANACTLDTCQPKTPQKLCMNLPFEGCCKNDGDCSGGDGVCSVAACVDGACAVLPKNCDDGVDCTIDTCDPKDGSCQNTLPKTQCQIDGACWKAGDAKPGSGGCQRCEPAIDPKAWTAKPGTCLIDGICVGSGETESGVACRVCLPDKDKNGWSVKAGECFVDGSCYPDGATALGSSCAVCDSSQTQTAWSGKAGTCVVGDTCYAAGEGPAGATCATCNPSQSTAGLTVAEGQCFIDGTCHASGAAKPGSGGCELCEPAKSKTGWTPKLGLPCDDGDACTKDDACTSALVCKGKPTGGSCCKSDDECSTQVQPAACEKAVCKGNGTCAVEPKTNCCSDGKCCDLPKGEFLPKGAICYEDPKLAEYKCEGGNGWVRKVGYGCTGDSASKCSSSVTGYGAWTLFKSCEGATSCHQSTPTSSPVCK
ncbi:MAG: hypothetical protein RIT45_3869 [Pseudomonadota bacterium]|jgi:hypothetical protein